MKLAFLFVLLLPLSAMASLGNNQALTPEVIKAVAALEKARGDSLTQAEILSLVEGQKEALRHQQVAAIAWGNTQYTFLTCVGGSLTTGMGFSGAFCFDFTAPLFAPHV